LLIDRELAAMQADYRSVTKKGKSIVLPLGKFRLVRVFVRALIGQGDYSRAATHLRPWLLDGEKDKQFDESSPAMSSVLVGIDQDSEFVQDAATEIELAFFSNEHYIMYKEPEEEEDDPEPYKLAKAFLKEYEKFPFTEDSCYSHLPELTIQAMDRVLKACRALMSLHSPIPGELGGSYKDMLDLWGNTDDYELCQNEDIFAAIVLKNKVMKMRILGYWSEGRRRHWARVP
jgi:hypothetical protein